MKINQNILVIVIIIVMFGTIFGTSVLGIYQTTNTKIPLKYSSGEFAGQYNPDDIRGSYSFLEISQLFSIPLDDLGNAFALQDKNKFATFLCKDLESIYTASKEIGKEVGTNSVSLFVALYKGLQIDLNNTTFLPNSAEDILLKTGKLTNEQKEFLSLHLIEPEKVENNSSKVPVTSENPSFIKGKTTFKEVLAIGVKKEDIEILLKTNIQDTTQVIKDFCTEKGLAFEEIKTGIQKLIDEK